MITLNAEQQAVVDHGVGPLLVNSCAGTGKTRCVVQRIARLIDDGCPAARILAVTFSKGGATEMNDRLRQLGVYEARVGTWHSLALQILRDDPTPWSNWEVDDGGRYKRLVREACGYQHLDWKGFDVTKVLRYIAACKANVELPETIEATKRARKFFAGLRDVNLATKAYVKVEALAQAEGLLTFDSMLVNVVLWLREEENRERWAARFDHVIVDEAHDNSPAQTEMWDLLGRDHRNVVLVGDFRQAIFGFRSADYRPFLGIEQKWGARRIDMVQNYRCGKSILEAANDVIRLGEVKPCPDAVACSIEHGRIEVCDAADVDEEAEEVSSWVRERVGEGAKHADLSVLFRVNAQSRALEEAFLRAKIPYRLIGGVNFYDRKSVRDLLSYLRAAFAPHSADDVARSLNAPFRYLGRAFVDKVREAWVDGEPMRAQLLRVLDTARIQERQRASVMEYLRLVEGLQVGFAEGAENPFKEVGAALLWLVEESRYAEWLKGEEGDEAVDNSALSDARELVRLSVGFRTPMDLLTYVNDTNRKAKRANNEDAVDRVHMMSIHRSKGLEFERVWVVGLSEGTLPHAKGDIEEERRLCYVAFTRAKKELVLSYTARMATPVGTSVVGRSRFLDDAKLIEEPMKKDVGT